MNAFFPETVRKLTRSARPALALAFLGTAFFMVPISSASAQVIVVKSSAKGINAGAILTNDTKLAVPAGAKVVLVLPSGKARTVKGPFNGRAGDLTKGVKSNPSVFDAVKRYVKTGGSTQKSVGAVRSAAPAFALGKPLPFSWRTVPITTSGDFCVEKGATISLVRTRTRNAQTLTIMDARSNRRVRVSFPAGKQSVSWPDDLDIVPGGTYRILEEGRRQAKEIRMRMITPLPQHEDTLQVLHGQRCQTQFRAFIREMQSTG